MKNRIVRSVMMGNRQESMPRLLLLLLLSIATSAWVNRDDVFDPEARGGGFVAPSRTNTCGQVRSNGFVVSSETVHVAAEEACYVEGMYLQDSDNGGQNFAWLDHGDYVQFDVGLTRGGRYDLRLEVASPDGQGRVHVMNADTEETIVWIDSLPWTGWWQNWDFASASVEMPEGSMTVRVFIQDSGFNLKSISFVHEDAGNDASSGGRSGFTESSANSDNEQQEDDSNNNEAFTVSSGFDSNARGGGFVAATPRSRCGTSRVKRGFTSESVIIKAEDLCESSGVYLQENDNGRSFNVAWIDGGDYMKYDVQLQRTGRYRMEVSVASPEGRGGLDLKDARSAHLYKSIKPMPASGDWQAWRTIEEEVDLPEGPSTLEIQALDGGWNFQSIRLTPLLDQVEEEEPVEEEEEVIIIGDLVAANDFSWTNNIQTEPSSEGVDNLAYMEAGDLLDFSVRLPESGMYSIEPRVAGFGDGAFLILDRENDEILADVSGLPNTDWWQNWQSFSAQTRYMSSGRHRLQLLILSSGFNLQSIQFRLDEEADSDDDTDIGVFVQADGFQQAQGIITEGTAGKLQSVAWIDATDWIDYELEIPATGEYRVTFTVASPGGQGTIKLLNQDTQEVYGTVSSVPQTPWWDVWADTSMDVILPRGDDLNLRLMMIDGGFNLKSIRFDLVDIVSARESRRQRIGYLYQAATDFDAMYGMQAEVSSPDNGMTNLAWVDGGDFVSYQVDIARSGRHRLVMSVASPEGKGAFQLLEGVPDIPTDAPTAAPVADVRVAAAEQPPRRRRRPDGTRQLEDMEQEEAEALPEQQVEEVSTRSLRRGSSSSSPQDNSQQLPHERHLQQGDDLEVLVERIDGIPNTGWWQTWTVMEREIELPSGSYDLTFQILEGGFNIQWFTLERL